jgi:hypothetical protein
MQPLGMRILVEKHSDEFSLNVPDWIGHELGNLLLIQFDGETLLIRRA